MNIRQEMHGYITKDLFDRKPVYILHVKLFFLNLILDVWFFKASVHDFLDTRYVWYDT